MPGLIGEVLGLAQQRLPFLARQAPALEIGPRPFAAMVEEADVVVGFLQRFDLLRDEMIELVEICHEIRRQVEIHGRCSLFYLCGPTPCLLEWFRATFKSEITGIPRRRKIQRE